MSPVLLFIIQITIITIAVLWGLKHLKTIFVSSTASVGRATTEGETLNCTVNFMIWDSEKAKQRKLQQFWNIGTGRVQAHRKEFTEMVARAEQEKADELAEQRAKKKSG